MGSIDGAIHRATRRSVAQADVYRKLETISDLAQRLVNDFETIAAKSIDAGDYPVSADELLDNEERSVNRRGLLSDRLHQIGLALVDLDMARERAKDIR